MFCLVSLGESLSNKLGKRTWLDALKLTFSLNENDVENVSLNSMFGWQWIFFTFVSSGVSQACYRVGLITGD